MDTRLRWRYLLFDGWSLMATTCDERARRIAVFIVTFLLAPPFVHAQSPEIDGNLTESFWAARPRVWAIDTPQGKARFNLGCDERFIYLAAELPAFDAAILAIDFGRGNDTRPTAATFEIRFAREGKVTWQHGDDPPTFVTMPANPAAAAETVVAVIKTSHTSASSQPASTAPTLAWTCEARIPWTQVGQNPPVLPSRTLALNFACCERESASVERLYTILPDVTEANFRQPSLWPRISLGWLAPLPFRARLQSLPLPGDPGPGENPWQSFTLSQDSPTGPWLNRQSWSERLAEMRRLRLNALILDHPSPIAVLVAPPTGVIHAQISRNIEQFTWLLAEAKRNNVSVYLGTRLDSIVAVRGIAQTSTATQPVAHTDVRSDHAPFTNLLDTYPELAGLFARTSEDFAGDPDLLTRTLVPALQTAATKRPAGLAPTLLVDTRHLSVRQLRGVLRTYPAVRLVANLQPPNTFEPTVDERLPRLLAEIAAEPGRKSTLTIPLVGIVEPQPAERYLYAGHPAWMYAMATDARRHGLDGLICSDEISWLAAEALAAYSISIPDVYNPLRWQKRLDDACGAGPYAAQLLETIQNACEIMPEFVSAVDGLSEQYMPQMGMPLVNYAEFPSRQRPRNPDAAADRILSRITTCDSRLSSLHHFEPENPRQADALKEILGRIDLNVALGRHLQFRLRAAAASVRLKAGISNAKDFLAVLMQGSDSWPPVVRAAAKLYPATVDYWRCDMISQPPWSPRQILAGFGPVTGGWADHSAILRSELDILSRVSPDSSSQRRLPLWDRLNATPEGEGEVVTFISFDKPLRDLRYALGPGAVITQTQDRTLKGKGSLLIDTRELGAGPHVVLRGLPGVITLRRDRAHQISIAYRVFERPSDCDDPFELGVMTPDGESEIGINRRWGAPPGCSSDHFTQIPALPREDTLIYVKIYGRALLVIDNLIVTAVP